MIKTYKLKLKANKEKLLMIRELVKEYRRVAKSVLNTQLYLFFKEGKVNKNHKFSTDTKLSARYLQTLQYQVVSMLDSYISNRQNDFKDIVINSNLEEKTKIKLLYINKYKKWFSNKVTIKGKLVEKEILKLARVIVKYTFKKNKFPNTKHIHLNLDIKVAKIETKKENKAIEFDYWIKLSTLEKGKPIYIPIKSNDYFENIKGKLKNFCQIIVKDKIEVGLMKEVGKRAYVPETDKIGLDLGLSNLFASNKGDLFSRRFIDKLIEYDKKTTKLRANIQKNKLKPTRSKRYKKLMSKVRSYLKNEINRVINRIIAIYKPKEIVIERLNFQSPKLSKKLNRILQTFGKGIISSKLNQLEEEYRIRVTEINPAYTSQTCSNCGYVSPKNRKSQSVFICEFCKKKQNSDVNAAKNILLRSSQEISDIYLSKSKILDKLIKKFIERYKKVSSCPSVVANPYLKGYLSYG